MRHGRIPGGCVLLSGIGVLKIAQDACAAIACALVSYGNWKAAEAAQAAPIVVFALVAGLAVSFWNTRSES